MSLPWPEFALDSSGLHSALDLLERHWFTGEPERETRDLSSLTLFPQAGLGARDALEQLAPIVFGGAQRLGGGNAFANMDPPTPWITWATALWNASLNQNLLHPATAPIAREIEVRVVRELAPVFGMDGGHMTSGSTVANITALWAARQLRNIDMIVASEEAHVSIGKAAQLLGLQMRTAPTDDTGALDASALPSDLSRACVVLTAGTTNAGSVDALVRFEHAAWTHVDAAWGGPLRLSSRYANRMTGIERADSVAVSAHKWLFQPKESALIFFRDTTTAHAAISFPGSYFAVPNVGLLGSHGAAAVSLLATMLTFGRDGFAAIIDGSMDRANALNQYLAARSDVIVFGPATTGITLWRPQRGRVDEVFLRLPDGCSSRTSLAGAEWIRQVPANPNADLKAIIEAIDAALA